jgi:ABC-type Fe3+-siderophore transport system permease subunit
MTRRVLRAGIKTVAGIGAAFFFLAPMATTTGLLWFVGSIIGLLVCFILLKLLEDDDENTGYWPPNPKT